MTSELAKFLLAPVCLLCLLSGYVVGRYLPAWEECSRSAPWESPPALTKPLPQIGDVWEARSDPAQVDPWSKTSTYIKVVDVKEGWVRHKPLTATSGFHPESTRLDTFHRLFELHARAWEGAAQ